MASSPTVAHTYTYVGALFSDVNLSNQGSFMAVNKLVCC